jgi:hypothetical protein
VRDCLNATSEERVAMAQPDRQVVPQPVLSPLTTSAIFLVVTIDPGGEPAARDLLADLPTLGRAVGFRDDLPDPPGGAVAEAPAPQ